MNLALKMGKSSQWPGTVYLIISDRHFDILLDFVWVHVGVHAHVPS